MTTITIICCGKSGVGKSSFGNHILTGNPNSDLFKQGDDVDEYGLTKTIQSEIRTITLPNGQQISVQYLDIPGTGDPTLDTKRFIEDIKNSYQKTKLNIALLLVSAQDNRKTLQEAFSCAFYKSFFDNNGLASNQVVWLVITRSQETQVSDLWVEKKLKSLSSDGITIDPNRVIKYRLGENSDLNPLLQQIGQTSSEFGYNFRTDLNNSVKEFKEMIDTITNTNKELRAELDLMRNNVNALQNQNQELSDNRDSLQKQNTQLEEQIKFDKENYEKKLFEAQSKPPQVIVIEQDCSIF